MKFKPKKILKWMLYVTGAIVLLIAGIILMLQYFFPSSFLISKIESYMKEKYNLGVKIENLDFSLFSGIKIDKFSFTDNDVPDSLFSMESFTLKYDLWPLLDKQLVVKTIKLDHPKINVVRDADGKFNFDGIIEKFKSKEPPKPEEPAEPSSGAKFIIDLKNFELNDLEAIYEDRSLENPMKAVLPLYSLKLTGVNFKDMDNYSADVEFTTGDRNGLIFTDKSNDIRFFQDMDIKISAKNENIAIDLKHNIRELRLRSGSMNIESTGAVGIGLTANYNLKTDSLDLQRLALNVSDMFRTEISGTVAGLSSSQKVKLSIPEIYADLDKLLTFVKADKLADLSFLSLKSSELSLNGLEIFYDAAQNIIKADGYLDLSAGAATYKQKDVSAVIKDLSLKSGFAVMMKDNKLSSSGVNLDLTLESISTVISGKKYSTGPQKLSIVPKLKSDFMPESAKLEYAIKDVAEGNINIKADASFDLSNTSIPALIKRTKADLIIKADRIHPHTIIDSAPAGLYVTLDEDLKYSRGELKNTLNVSTEYENEAASMYSAARDASLETYIHADISGHLSSKYKIFEFTAKLNDMFSSDIKDLFADLGSNDLSMAKFDVTADLDELLKVGKATGIPQIQNTRLYKGSLNISAEGGGNITKQESTSELRLDLKADSLYHDDIALKNGLTVSQKVNLITKDISLIGDINVSGGDYAGILKEMGINGNAKLENNIRYTETGEVRINKLSLSVPALETDLNVKGTANLKDSVNMYDLEITHKLGLQKKYPFLKGIYDLKGNISGATKLKGNMKSASVEHTETIQNISMVMELDSLGNEVRIVNLNADIPLNAKLDLKEMKLNGYKKYDMPDEFDFIEYKDMREHYRKNGVPVSNLKIDTVAVDHKLFRNTIRNIDLDVFFDNNKFCLNRFYYEIFDGNTDGFVRLDLGEGGFDDIITRANLDLGLTMTGLNTYYLNRKKTKHSPSTELNVIVKLNSKGLDFINEPDLNGEINLSKLSGDDAKYLLEFLNKNSGDQTAGMIKNTLNAFPGIKVDLFSFTIKNNFIYTLIKLKKPWYLVYFPLPEQISLSKQSLKFYLDKYVKEDL
jgi:hypothetical protein